MTTTKHSLQAAGTGRCQEVRGTSTKKPMTGGAGVFASRGRLGWLFRSRLDWFVDASFVQNKTWFVLTFPSLWRQRCFWSGEERNSTTCPLAHIAILCHSRSSLAVASFWPSHKAHHNSIPLPLFSHKQHHFTLHNSHLNPHTTNHQPQHLHQHVCTKRQRTKRGHRRPDRYVLSPHRHCCQPLVVPLTDSLFFSYSQLCLQRRQLRCRDRPGQDR